MGIGTTAPQTKLDVDGTVQMTGFSLPTAPTAGHVLTSDASGSGTWQAPAAGGGDGDWTISGSDMFSAVSGNVGIGTSSPNAELHVKDTGDNSTVFRISNAEGSAGVSQTNVMESTFRSSIGLNESPGGRIVFGKLGSYNYSEDRDSYRHGSVLRGALGSSF